MIKLGWENDRGGWYIKKLWKRIEEVASKLFDFNSLDLITSHDDDAETLINVDGENQRITIENLITGNLFKHFSGTTDIKEQLDALNPGTYFGYINSYGHPEANMPENASYFLRAIKVDSTFISADAIAMDGNGTYSIIKDTNGWHLWNFDTVHHGELNGAKIVTKATGSNQGTYVVNCSDIPVDGLYAVGFIIGNSATETTFAVFSIATPSSIVVNKITGSSTPTITWDSTNKELTITTGGSGQSTLVLGGTLGRSRFVTIS